MVNGSMPAGEDLAEAARDVLRVLERCETATVSISWDGEDDCYRLYVSSIGRQYGDIIGKYRLRPGGHPTVGTIRTELEAVVWQHLGDDTKMNNSHVSDMQSVVP